MKRYFAHMSRTVALIAMLVASLASTCHGAAPVPIEMLMRNGLTDAQIKKILSKDPNAVVHVNGSTWRNVEFNTQRYNNVTNWLAVIGETNDFAKLVVPVTATNELLTAENLSLRSENKTIARQRDSYYSAYTNSTAHVERLQEDVAALQTANTNLTIRVEQLTSESSELHATIRDEIAFLQNLARSIKEMAKRYPQQESEITFFVLMINHRIIELGGDPIRAR